VYSRPVLGERQAIPVMKRKKLLAAIAATYGTSRRQGRLQLAKALGMSEGAVTKWILRERTPPNLVQKRIEKLTNGQMSLYDW
jgi:hypothetical protein